MAIVDLAIIPLGTETPSMSSFVVDIQKILNEFQNEGKIKYQLTPMSTIIEGELSDIFEIIYKIHKKLFNNGSMRLATNIRIDDRKDKETVIKNKIKSVNEKM